MKKMRFPAQRRAPSGRRGLRQGHADMAGILTEGENVVAEGIIHWGIYWKGAVLMVVGLTMVLTPAANLGFFLVAVAGLVLGMAWLARYYLALILTNRRVMVRYGVVNVDFVEMRFSQIESVETMRSLVARLLGFASVVVSGTGQRVVIVPYIANAGAFRQALNEILLKREEKNGQP